MSIEDGSPVPRQGEQLPDQGAADGQLSTEGQPDVQGIDPSQNQGEGEFQPESIPEPESGGDLHIGGGLESTGGSDNSEGRYDYDKAETIAHAVHETIDPVRDEEIKDLREKRSQLNLDSYYDRHEGEVIDSGIDVLKYRRQAEISSRDSLYAEICDLNPDVFKAMSTAEFLEIKERYEVIKRAIRRSQDAIDAHDKLIDELNWGIENRQSQILDSPGGDRKHYGWMRVFQGHFATSVVDSRKNDPYWPFFKNSERRSFSLGEMVELVEYEDEEGTNTGKVRAERLVVEFKERGEIKEAEVLQKIIDLSDTFDLTPRDRMAGYRDLLATYWKPLAEEYNAAAKADLEKMKNEYRQSQPEHPTEESVSA